MKKIYSVILMFAIILPVMAGPFGFDRGDTVEKLSYLGLEEVHPNIFKTVKSPTQTNVIEEFYLYFSTKSGLAKVRADMPITKTDVYGSEIKRSYIAIGKILTRRYGKASSQFDYLRSGSIWNEERDFTMSLIEKERELSAYWTGNLPDNLNCVVLEPSVLRRDSFYLRIIYDFKNIDDLVKEKDESDKKGF